ncbi:39S ribosomal protein L19, mitochondrial-like [Anastrepha obliqua]|uniref:39S ribosomal protein L19, mitochondrial-like n=1 Tax=Anastrepha obliqua TaxID=95512 RepID=UPI00240A4C71|nr:39S ribosomal protein L19, mitochondrial-like [Anastrepha obliqua]
MNISTRMLSSSWMKRSSFKRIVTFSTKPQGKEFQATQQKQIQQSAPGGAEGRKSVIPSNYRFIYPEFLPDPKVEWRNPVREKLERMDMLDRRTKIDIPEFYVGSILAVTSSDPHAAGKVSRFVGICIHRDRCGLRNRFILRNVIDHKGVEVRYELYDPTIHKIEVLRLEKRLDDHLLYLRDALPEYSTVDLNMEPEFLDESAEVPVNDIKVVLRPRPWLERWERQNLQGVANVDQYITNKQRRQAQKHEKPWEKYDIMKQYRATIPEEEQKEIFAEVHSQLHHLELQRKRNKRKRSFVKPTKLA